MIKKLLQAAALLAACSGAAHASTFDFSYTFGDGQSLTGSLDGTLSGTSITNISDLQVSLDGIAFSGGSDANGATSLAIYGYDTSNGSYDTSAAFSTVAAKNNFVITDENPNGANQANYYFTFVNDPSFGSEVVASNFLQSNGSGSTQLALDAPDDGTWKVTQAPVPLPAALPLLASGLALFGIGRRRRAV